MTVSSDNSLHVKDWELGVATTGLPTLTVSDRDGTTMQCLFEREDLPELIAGLLRLADHLRQSPPCGVVRPE